MLSDRRRGIARRHSVRYRPIFATASGMKASACSPMYDATSRPAPTNTPYSENRLRAAMRSEKRTVTQRKKRLPIRPRAEDSTCSVWTARPTASIRCPTDSKQNANGTGGERIRMVPPHFPAL